MKGLVLFASFVIAFAAFFAESRCAHERERVHAYSLLRDARTAQSPAIVDSGADISAAPWTAASAVRVVGLVRDFHSEVRSASAPDGWLSWRMLSNANHASNHCRNHESGS